MRKKIVEEVCGRGRVGEWRVFIVEEGKEGTRKSRGQGGREGEGTRGRGDEETRGRVSMKSHKVGFIEIETTQK